MLAQLGATNFLHAFSFCLGALQQKSTGLVEPQKLGKNQLMGTCPQSPIWEIFAPRRYTYFNPPASRITDSDTLLRPGSDSRPMVGSRR